MAEDIRKIEPPCFADFARKEEVAELAKVREKSFHFGAGVLIALARGGLDALGEDAFGLFAAFLLSEILRVHLVARDVIRVRLEKRFKMRLGGREVAVFDAFESEAVKSERIVGILGEEFFKFLAAGFLLFAHGVVSYYTWRTNASKSEVERGEQCHEQAKA